MNDIKVRMINIYKTYDFDWMNYVIVNEELTYHHIVKEECGGKLSLDNGALLTSRAHEYLHLIERTDIVIYDRINQILKDINTQKHAPNYRQRKKIDLLLLEFETKNADKIIRKNKKLGKKRVMMATNLRIDSQMHSHKKK